MPGDEVKIAEERHYQLVPADSIQPEDLKSYATPAESRLQWTESPREVRVEDAWRQVHTSGGTTEVKMETLLRLRTT